MGELRELMDPSIVGQHEELTGKVRIKQGWFRKRVQHEVVVMLTIDDSNRWDNTVGVRQEVYKRYWI